VKPISNAFAEALVQWSSQFLSLDIPNQVNQTFLTIHETVGKSWTQFGHISCMFSPQEIISVSRWCFWTLAIVL